LCKGPTRKLDLIVRNTTGAPMEALKLDPISATGASVKPVGVWGLPILPITAAHRFQAEVSLLDDDRFAAGNLLFRLEYRDSDALKLVTAPVAVKRASTEVVYQVARFDLKVASGTISDAADTSGYFALTNLSNHHLQIAMTPPRSSDLKFDWPETKQWGWPLEPGAAVSIPFTVTTTSKIELKGKRTLVGSATVTWKDAGCPRSGTLLATQDVDVGITAEAGILTVLGVPTWFVLPGFLAMAVWSLVWTGGWRFGSERETFPYASKSVEFWFFAILVSLAIMLVIHWSTGTGYWNIYSLSDVLWIWGSTTIGAFLIHAAGHFSILRYKQGKAARLADRTPSAADGPADLVRKLARVDASAYLVECEVAGQRGLIFPGESAIGKVWVFSPICLRLKPDNAALEAKIEEQRKPSGKLAVIWALLDAGGSPGLASIEWVTGGARSPVLIERNGLSIGGPALVIEEVVS
jgi:hypothetical protein